MAIRIDDKKWRKLLRQMERVKKPRVKVGILASRGGTRMHPDSGLSMVEIAAVHEFGAPGANIPERSFIRRPFETTRGKATFRAIASKLSRKILEERFSMRKALEILGQWGVSEIRKWVTQGSNLEPLKTATIARKKSSRPLIDTGRLLNAVSHEVEV